MARRVNNLEFAIREGNRRSEVQNYLGWRWLQDGTREIQVVFGNKSYTKKEWEKIQEEHNWPFVAERHYRRVKWTSDRIRKVYEYRVEITWAPMWINEALFGEPRQDLDEFLHEHLEPIGQVVQVVQNPVAEEEENRVVHVEQNGGVVQVQAYAVDQQADEQMQIEMAPVAEPNIAPLAEMEIVLEAGDPNGGAMPPVPEPVVADVDMMEGAMLLLEFAGQFAL